MGAPLIGAAQAAVIAGVRLIDYQRPACGVLVSSGSGIMLGVMDAVPALRWCVDIDVPGAARDVEFFLRLLDGEAAPIGICGWFSITKPDQLRSAVKTMREPPVVYTGNVRLGAGIEAHTLEAFIYALRHRRSTLSPDLPPRVTVSVLRI
jgi:hypothetical protein